LHVRRAKGGIDSEGIKHPLGLIEGATEHSAVVQALIDDLIERGLDLVVKIIRLSPVVMPVLCGILCRCEGTKRLIHSTSAK
jgi:hypothetical protein